MSEFLEDHWRHGLQGAGTRLGITALQMDIKIQGITVEILTEALAQAKKAPFWNHDVIEATIPVRQGGANCSEWYHQDDVDKIEFVIGKGGETIDKIITETGVKIDIDERRNVSNYSSDQAAINRAKEIIAGLVREAKVDRVYHAKIQSEFRHQPLGRVDVSVHLWVLSMLMCQASMQWWWWLDVRWQVSVDHHKAFLPS